MRQEVVARFRNSFAHLLLELMSEPPSSAVESAFELPFSTVTESDWRRAVQLWREHAGELLEALPRRPCPACGSEQSRWLFESYDAHQFHGCSECGCWFTRKVVDWSVFERLFERSPEARDLAARMMGQRDQDVREVDMRRIGAYLDDLLPLIARHDGRPIAYLDAGCGTGASLRVGLQRGLVVQGVEVDDAAVAIARKANLPVALPAEIDSMPRGPYQLLTFWETLEHIAEPLAALQHVVPLLAEDGLVGITVPNLNAPATRAMREACTWVHGGYNTPGHVNLFNVRALERLLARAGLTVIDAEGQFSDNPEELLAFMSGESRGVFDVLDPPKTRGHLPAVLGPLLTDVWPGMALIEQYTLSSPILGVVACRCGQEARFSAMVAERRAARLKRLADEARRLISFEVDYKAQSEAWQKLQREQHDLLQAEVDRRDELLRERDQMLLELRDTWRGQLSFFVWRLTNKLTGRR
jgi:SAM-dependent methyltransferase